MARSSTRLFAAFLGVALYAVALGAFAQQAPVPLGPQLPSMPVHTERQWYGWQTLIGDLASAGLMTAGLAVNADATGYDSGRRFMGSAIATLGVAGYAAGAPTLHFINHHPLGALGSIGLRLALPTLGAAIGAGAANCSADHQEGSLCPLSQLVLGVGVGALAAIALDASVLAWTRAPEHADATTLSGLGIAPMIASDGKSGELRIFGSF